MSLLSYATQAWEADGPNNQYFDHSPSSRVWLSDLSRLIEPLNETEEGITLILCQLSAAVSTGRPLPPKMQTPRPYLLSEKLRRLDPEVLHIKHMHEIGYSAYAVMEIISSMIIYKLDILVATIEQLVGVINFELLEQDLDGGEHDAEKED